MRQVAKDHAGGQRIPCMTEWYKEEAGWLAGNMSPTYHVNVIYSTV
ncbi:hypothetical protein SXCC_01446 [Gluconacetobacter sp. SXCC-1]|nr:hypothetical protein SXCC_01446 [Gluconacetobacter sp. SXCC-1]